MATDCLDKIPIRLKQPIETKGRWVNEISVPCGKCARCIQRRKMEWTFRMMHEMTESKTAYFVTLTYAPEWVPYNKYGRKVLVETREKDLKIHLQEQGRKRITKAWKKKQPDRSIQGYMKRVRTNQGRSGITIEHLKNNLKPNDKIKFFAAGEYGEERSRPHYHAIIYNASRKIIEESWNYGHVHVVQANEQLICYLMKYLEKQLGQEPDKLKPREFNIMSEGIGKGYIKKMKEWHRQNKDVLYVRMKSGILVPMPRYIRNLIFNEEERKEQVILVEQIIQENKEELINEWGLMRYNEIISEQRTEDERRFKKKIKKRIVD